MAHRDWQNQELRELGVFLNGDELGLTTTGGEPVVDDSFAVLLNATPEDVVFRLPPRRFGLEWELCLSTARPAAEPDRLPGRASLEVPARSLALLRRVR
jgi:glycogen operon protein